MERLGIAEIGRLDVGYVSERRRGAKERTSGESSSKTLRNEQVKLDNKPLKRSPPSSASSSKKDETTLGILVAVGENTTNDRQEGSGKSLSDHGWISVIGRRRAMEDAVTVAIGDIEGYDLYAVYDGHGGPCTANACKERLHLIIAEEVERRKSSNGGGGLEYWEQVMNASFLKMDEEVNIGDEWDGKQEASAIGTIGCTAVVVMVGKEELVVANCGDSRAVLCRGGDVAVPLSSDHKPDRPDEKRRVEEAGGTVVDWKGCRVLGVLATSRSIGIYM